MFTRKHSTVASIMETFRKIITDLDDIVERNISKSDNLHAERNTITFKLEDVDLEIHQARGTRDRMSDLVFGAVPDKDEING